MAEGTDKGLRVIELASMIVIGIFAAVVILWFFGWLAGMVWWAIKIVALGVILAMLVRWAFRRSTL